MIQILTQEETQNKNKKLNGFIKEVTGESESWQAINMGETKSCLL